LKKNKAKFPPLQFEFKEAYDIFAFLIGALYDCNEKTAYFFCVDAVPEDRKQEFIEGLPQSITHETIHYVIHKVAGEEATNKFDNIWFLVNKWDKEVCGMLF